jgi:hypothetical protein
MTKAIWRLVYALPMAAVFGLLLRSSAIAGPTLGAATHFALESTDGALTTDSNAYIGNDTTPKGSVGALDYSTVGKSSQIGNNYISDIGFLNLGPNTVVSGECATNGGSITKGVGAKCVAGATTTAGNPFATDFEQSVKDLNAFETAVIALPPDQTLSVGTVPIGSNVTITNTKAGQNVIKIIGDVTPGVVTPMGQRQLRGARYFVHVRQ